MPELHLGTPPEFEKKGPISFISQRASKIQYFLGTPTPGPFWSSSGMHVGSRDYRPQIPSAAEGAQQIFSLGIINL